MSNADYDDNTERPTPLVEDLEGTREKLASWFARQLHSDGPVNIPSLTIPEGSGMSNVTLLFDIEYQRDGQRHRDSCVGRLQPEIASPVFPEYDLSIQYRAMAMVSEHTDVPVPELLGLEQDASVLGTAFYIMRRAEGRVPSDMPPYNMDGWMLQESPDLCGRMWTNGVSTMADLHRQTADTATLGFDALLSELDPGADPLDQQLNYWSRYQAWSMDGAAHSIVDPALEWLKANRPKARDWGLCWGDARFGNMMFAEDGAVAKVLDWEMIRLGDPLQDIAWWNYLDYFFSEGLNMPRLHGLPKHEASTALWEQRSGFTAPQTAYDYYFVYAGMRYGAILSRIMLGQGQTDQVQENFATTILRTVMEERC